MVTHYRGYLSDRWGRSLAALLVLLVLTGCSFVHSRGSQGQLEYESITAVISDLEIARREGLAVDEWWDAYRSKNEVPLAVLLAPTGSTWDEFLAHLYAARSASRVRHSPYVSASLTCFELWWHGPWEAWQLFLAGALMAPVDAVFFPGWLVVAPIGDLCVEDQVLDAAVSDLTRARALGYDRDRASDPLFGAPTWGYLHLDRLGYDCAPLEQRE